MSSYRIHEIIEIIDYIKKLSHDFQRITIVDIDTIFYYIIIVYESLVFTAFVFVFAVAVRCSKMQAAEIKKKHCESADFASKVHKQLGDA